MAKKEQQNQPETTREETAPTPPEAEVRETPEANEAPEAPGTAETPETPETNPFEEKYNAEHDSFLRLAAEFDNFRKRTVKEKEASYGNGKADAVEKMLPVYDNLERALNQPTEDAAYKKGVELTMNELVKIFTGLGVEIFGAVGDSFDPNLHNAVMQVESEEFESGVVAQELQKGYTHHGSVVRHSMVSVVK